MFRGRGKVTDDLKKEHMRDFELDLFLNLGGHLDSHGGARRDDTLEFAAESREETASIMRLSRLVCAAAESTARSGRGGATALSRVSAQSSKTLLRYNI